MAPTQPYYPEMSAAKIPCLGALHGVKDYYGMALQLLEFPEMHCTINLVPSLLLQLTPTPMPASDRFLDVSRIPADSLSEDDCLFLLDHFFMANADHMILPFPAMASCISAAPWAQQRRDALRRFHRAISAICNLVQPDLDSSVGRGAGRLPGLAQKGRNFTEEDRETL